MPVRTTLWADLICPFCYLAAATIGRLAREGAIELRLRPFESAPETPEEGVPLERFGKERVAALYREVGWLANEAGVTLLRPDRLPNSRRALEGVEAARAALGEKGAIEFAGRVMGAYFAKGEDVGREDVLRAIAQATGMDARTMDRWLLGGAFAGAVDAARRDAEAAMVTAVPVADVAGFPVAGYKPYEQLRRYVEKAAGKAR